MHEYNICNIADEEIFKKQCDAILKKVPGIRTEDEITDVDKSVIHIYETDNGAIRVYLDYNIGAVYVKSNLPLKQYFK